MQHWYESRKVACFYYFLVLYIIYILYIFWCLNNWKPNTTVVLIVGCTASTHRSYSGSIAPPGGQEAPQHAEIMKLQSLYSGVRMFSENKERKGWFFHLEDWINSGKSPTAFRTHAHTPQRHTHSRRQLQKGMKTTYRHHCFKIVRLVDNLKHKS